MSLKKLCALLGWERCRRWTEFTAKVKTIEATAAVETAPEEAPESQPANRYDLSVRWSRSGSRVGRRYDGSMALFAHGRVKGQRSSRISLTSKRGGVYHLVFLPREALSGRPVLVNGHEIGKSRVSVAPGSEWGKEGLVEHAFVKLDADAPFISSVAAAIGKSL